MVADMAPTGINTLALSAKWRIVLSVAYYFGMFLMILASGLLQ